MSNPSPQPPPAPSHERKPWLSTEVSVQWVAGLAIAFLVWTVRNDRAHTSETAVLESKINDRASLIERRNREIDTMQAQMDRQTDRFERRIMALEAGCRRP